MIEPFRGIAIRFLAWLLRAGSMRVDWWVCDPDGTVLRRGRRWNLITNAGRQQWHLQSYGTSGLASLGFCYCALSADAVTETATSTSLSNEIASNGLSRVQCGVSLPVSSGNQTVLTASWTASGVGIPAPQKGALFNASSNGVMNHVFGFSQGAVTLAAGQSFNIRGVVTMG